MTNMRVPRKNQLKNARAGQRSEARRVKAPSGRQKQKMGKEKEEHGRQNADNAVTLRRDFPKLFRKLFR